MHAEHSTLEVLAHAMIAFLFLYRCATAVPEFDRHVSRFRTLGVPFPAVVLAGGLATMLIGGVMVALDYQAWIGAIMLIVFTVLANLLYHHFWAIEDAQRKQTHLQFFCNNIAVMGGLLMVVV